MTPTRLLQCLNFTWRRENDGQPYHVTPGDSGGPTAWGVTLKTYAEWRLKKGPTTAPEDLAKANQAVLAELYHDEFWTPLACDSLPAGIDLLVFDFAVCAGPSESAITLQRAVGAKQDGEIGPITLAKVTGYSPYLLPVELGWYQADSYLSDQGYTLFGNGWERRTRDRLYAALQTIYAGA